MKITTTTKSESKESTKEHNGDGTEVYRLGENYIRLDEGYDSRWYYHQNLEEPVDWSEKVLNVQQL